jgi:uncharacterized protein (TIGR03000 family)
MHGALLLAALAVSQAKPAPVPEPAPLPRKDGLSFPAQAVIIVRLPPDAELYIDRHYMRSMSDRRTFVTCPLWPDATYFYDLRMHVVRDSRTFTDFRRVTFRAGDVIEVVFPEFPVPGTVGTRSP